MAAEIRDEAEFRNSVLERLDELEFRQSNFQIFEEQNVSEKEPGLAILESTDTSPNNAKDSGDVSGTLTLVFDTTRFCRMRVIGDLAITFDTSNLLVGKWQQLTVEILQDPTGNHNVTFTDAPFENQITPVVYKAANRYTTIRFYAYRISDSAVRIFAFEENQPFSKDFFDSYIQARLTNDQLANLSPNDHLEFNLKIATDNTISVSTGVGQISGQFTNFKQGHLYQCECHSAIEGSIPSSELAFQFYNVTKASFFGSQGRVQITSHALQDSNLPVAKGFFIADDVNDVVEVRIRANSGTTKVIAGNGSAEPTTYVIIKDCGVAGLANLEGNLINAPLPTEADTFGFHHLFAGEFSSYGSSFPLHVSFNGNASNGGIDMNHIPFPRSGNWVSVVCHVSQNNATGKTNIFTRVVNTQVLVGDIPANNGAEVRRFEADQAFLQEDRISVVIDRTDDPGTIRIHTNMEVLITNGGQDKTLISGAGRYFGQDNRFQNIVGPPYDNSPGPGQGGSESQWTWDAERDGIIVEMWHYGTAPAGTGNFDLAARVNGIDKALQNVPVKGSISLTKYTINIPFKKGDKINWRVHPRQGSNAEFVIIGRVILF